MAAVVRRLRVAEVAVERVAVLDGLVFLAETEAESDGVGERLVGVLALGVVLRVLLVPGGGFVVDRDGLVVTADLVDRLLARAPMLSICSAG